MTKTKAKTGGNLSSSPARERRGIGAAPGIVMGPVFCIRPGSLEIPRYLVAAADRGAETERFVEAVALSCQQIETLKQEITREAGPAADDLSDLLEAHIQMLSGSRLIRGVEDRISQSGLNAEAGVQDSVEEIAEQYQKIEDSYLAGRIHDIREVGARMLRNLTRAPMPRFSNVPQGCILFAGEITPADAALMDPGQVRGFAAVLGGAEGHTAIMARSLGLPAVLGVAELLLDVENGSFVILDGRQGRVLIDPEPQTIEEYQRRQGVEADEKRRLARLRELPAVTRDAVKITLSANTDLPIEVALALENGAEGIGLVRTEFMFLNRRTLPDEDEQFDVLSDIVRAMKGKPVTIRTLDIGGEKFSESFRDKYKDDSPNPALGLRAIRFSLEHRDLFEVQIAAILRAGGLGPIRILLPMITNVSEVRDVRRLIERVHIRLIKEGRLPQRDLPPIGVMIEVPAAALAADALAREADFFSIGTNDLTMYALAIDRANDQVAGLYDPLHPAVLRLIQFAVNAGLSAGLPVNVCGEMAGDERLVPLLIGLGITELSMNATALPRVKARIRGMDLTAACRCATSILKQSDRARIEAILADFNEMYLGGPGPS